MKILIKFVLLLTAAGLAGCAADPQRAMSDPVDRQIALARTYHDYFDEAAANAVIRQATVFPHYFEPRTAKLTELGRHDLSILANYLKANPGDVRMGRTGIADSLYEQRSRAVLSFLTDHEVPAGTVRVVDARPDGDGMASEQVVRALAAESEQDQMTESASFTLPVVRQGGTNAATKNRSK